MNDYTSAAVSTILIIALLVIVLIGGGILVLNLGMLSKRHNDRVGERNPSDLDILKNETWPESPYDENILPAATDEEENRLILELKRQERLLEKEQRKVKSKIAQVEEAIEIEKSDHQTQVSRSAQG